jgi:hypothetical protein
MSSTELDKRMCLPKIHKRRGLPHIPSLIIYAADKPVVRKVNYVNVDAYKLRNVENMNASEINPATYKLPTGQ